MPAHTAAEARGECRRAQRARLADAGFADPAQIIDEIASGLLFTKTPDFCKRLRAAVDAMMEGGSRGVEPEPEPAPAPGQEPDERRQDCRTVRLLRDLTGNRCP